MTKRPKNMPCLTILCLAVLGLAALCSAQTDSGYALIIQKSPCDGGVVTPGEGIHKFGLNQMVTLTAEPKPGYRFLYWMGDVTEMTCNYTSVWVDSPKIVIAVFERTEFELPEDLGFSSGGGAGADGAMGVGSGWHMGYGISTGSGTSQGYRHSVPPGGNPGGEQSIPEPATLFLLGLGSLWSVGFRTGR